MKTSSLRFASILVLAGAASACGQSSSASSFADSSSSNAGKAPSADPALAPSGAAARAIAEADIIQVDDARGRLYAMSKSGSLAVVDVSVPGRLALLGKTMLPGEPFEMYRRGDVLLAMSNGAISPDGTPVALASDDGTYAARDLAGGAIVTALDVSSPVKMRTIESFQITGEIADSRLVGDILYLATYENGSCWHCDKGARTLVTSFDVASSSALVPVDQVEFKSAATTDFNAAWATPWKRSIVVTSERMYVGGLATSSGYGSTTGTGTTGAEPQGVIEVLDIRDPAGKIGRGASIATAGPMLSRWQVDEDHGVLRVISQEGAGSTSNGTAYPEIETFRVESATTITPLGHQTLKLPRQEGLKTVRFDGSRAYAITFNQTDPLFVIDLSDPASPKQRGELKMPGWMFHLEPRGDRVVGLGLDRTDTKGNLNVSLFDVSDLDAPKLLSRVPFGPTRMYEDYQITEEAMAEDQDRIQKAFTVADDGLITIPFATGDGCSSASGSGVQLIDWQSNSLFKAALLPVAGHPRRALRKDGHLLAVSDSNVRAFSLARIDVAVQTADVVIGSCEPSSSYSSSNNGRGYYNGARYDDSPTYDSNPRYGHCAVSHAGGASSSGFAGALAAVAALVALRRRREGRAS